MGSCILVLNREVVHAPLRALMPEFHRVAWDRKTVVLRVEALRRAQLLMLREGDKRGMLRRDKEEKSGRVPPYYWAAFVLSGDWR